MAATHISFPVVDEARRHALASQVVIAVGSLIQRLAEVATEGLVLTIPMEVALAMARAVAEGRPRKGPAHEASKVAIQVACGRREALLIRKGATNRPQAAPVRAMAAARVSGVRGGRPLAGQLPRPDLAPRLVPREVEETRVLQVGS